MIKNSLNVYSNRLKFLQSARRCVPNRLLLGLGANISGTWGTPPQTLERAMAELAAAGLRPLCRSRLFQTKPLGPGHQPSFVNAALLVAATLPPAALLRLVKGLERKAGRRLGQTWGPRPLDIDILDFGGRRLGWPPPRQRRGRLILPHPEAHRRAFVLLPLADIAPAWRHPVLGATPARLIRHLGARLAPEIAAKPLISCPAHAKNHER